MKKMIVALIVSAVLALFGSAALLIAGDTLPGGSYLPFHVAGDTLPGGS